MGLDTTHGCWHGAYSAFMRWREKIAAVAGIPLPLMEGFWGFEQYEADILNKYEPKESPFRRDGGSMVATRETLMPALEEAMAQGDAGLIARMFRKAWTHLPIKWDSLKPDPLHILLSHSDCDGEIAVKDLLPIADRLTTLLPLLNDDGNEWGHIGSYRAKTQTFIDGLRLAAKQREPVEFH